MYGCICNLDFWCVIRFMCPLVSLHVQNCNNYGMNDLQVGYLRRWFTRFVCTLKETGAPTGREATARATTAATDGRWNSRIIRCTKAQTGSSASICVLHSSNITKTRASIDLRGGAPALVCRSSKLVCGTAGHSLAVSPVTKSKPKAARPRSPQTRKSPATTERLPNVRVSPQRSRSKGGPSSRARERPPRTSPP